MKLFKLEKYRPALHFSPKKNWMNDPNGLVFFKGEYHLFFQHNPNDNIWGPMHWGHAVSKDMIDWEELDIALYPDENGTIFSGSAVIDWNNTTGFFPEEPGMVAIFTHHLDRGPNTPPVQSQSLAYSHDKGRTWVKYEGNPVLTHPEKIDFRDPKVFWYEEAQRWIMVLATGQTVSLYSSTNLKNWDFESEFGTGAGCHDGVWECPDLFELTVDNTGEKKWVLLVSIGDNPQYDAGSRTQYFVGTFDGSQFVSEHTDVRWLDFGKDNYAGVSFSDIPDGRRIYLGWMSNWRYADKVPTDGWRNQMTIPRELCLRKMNDNYQIIQKPVKELDTYFSLESELKDLIVSNLVKKEYMIDKAFFGMNVSFENIDAANYGLIIQHKENQFTMITIDTKEQELVLDRSRSGKTDFSSNFKKLQKLKLSDTQQLQICVIHDSSSVELIINDGEQALTSLIYPDKVCESISFFASEGSMKIPNIKLFKPFQR